MSDQEENDDGLLPLSPPELGALHGAIYDHPITALVIAAVLGALLAKTIL